MRYITQQIKYAGLAFGALVITGSIALAQDAVRASLPDTADRIRAQPVELSVLVGVLKTLLDESVPIVAFKQIVQAFAEARKKGASRLAIVQAIRCIPEVRTDLPGNNSNCSFYRVGLRLQETISSAITTVNGFSYLALEPKVTQRILQAVRKRIHSGLQENVALLVDNPSVRRFMKKVVELEFPYLPVLSTQELLEGLDRNIIDAMDLES